MCDAATDFARLFSELYLRLHARSGKSTLRLTPQSSAALQHLALAGPLTIGEIAQHFERSQSVVSEIIDGLERKQLVERVRDQRDRRRTLVWLTQAAQEALSRSKEVLDHERLEQALELLAAPQRKSLLEGMSELVRAADRLAAKRRKP